MVFKSFRYKIIIRLLIIVVLISLIFYFLTKPHYGFTAAELIIVVIALIIELIYFVEKGYKQVNQMLGALNEKDFTLRFKPVERGSVFNDQAKILSNLMKVYQDVKIEKEMHYQFLQLIVDQLSYGITCFDVEGHVSLANKTVLKLCGVNEISNVSILNRIDSNLGKEISSLKTGDERLVTVINEGEISKYTISCSEIKLLDKTYKLVTFHNLSSSFQELELDSHKKLIRILTHEIMNSVTPILSLSEAMNENLKDEKGNKRDLKDLSKVEEEDIILGNEAIETRSRALMRFVNDFRSLSRLPDPKLELINIEELFKNIISLYKSTVEEKGIKLSLFISTSINQLYADKAMVEQVAINLLKNSVEALANIFRPEIVVDVNSDNKFLLISFSDNGKGIIADDLDKVFVPFYSTKHEGSGIGLSLSQQVMFLHGGSIQVKSIPNLKTTFTLRFPLASKA